MATVSYLLYDVFTDTPLTGNPLAVAIDPPPLTTEQCAAIAGELNLSETIFLWTGSDRPEGSDITARIFTPSEELPFAGHPTVGGAIALRDEGHVGDRVVLAEGVGSVEVSITDGRAELRTAIAPQAVGTADPDEIARSLGLVMADLHPAFGPRGWSAGVPFTVVAVRDTETLGRCQVDLGVWNDTVAFSDAPWLYVIAPLDGTSGGDWQARMFAPGPFGVAEDPATGSAAAATVGFLAGAASASRLAEGWRITQGVEMGRPSDLRAGAVLRGAELVAATVAGSAVRVGRGELEI